MSERTARSPRSSRTRLDLLLIGGGMACCGAAYEIDRWAERQGRTGTQDHDGRQGRHGPLRRRRAWACRRSTPTSARTRSEPTTSQGPQRPDGHHPRGPDLRPGPSRRRLGPPLRGVGPADLEDRRRRLPPDGVEARDDGKPTLKDGGKPVRSGKWQIMINGESYKLIVAEAAKKALGTASRIAGARLHRQARQRRERPEARRRRGRLLGAREQDLHLQGQGDADRRRRRVNVFRPRSIGRGQGRAWYPVWNAGSDLRDGGEAGAEMTMMENRFVPARFKDGYGPVGAWFLLFKAQGHQRLRRGLLARTRSMLDDYPPVRQGVRVPASCLRNHLMLKEMKEGRGPIYMDTVDGAGASCARRDAEGGQAPRGRGLGGLPRHVHRPVRHLGRREHRARQEDLRDDADRALPARLALRLRRHLGARVRPTSARRPPRRLRRRPAHLPRGWNWGYHR